MCMQLYCLIFSVENEPLHDKTNKMPRALSEDLEQLAKPTFRSRYAHTPSVTEQSEGPMDTVASGEDSDQSGHPPSLI